MNLQMNSESLPELVEKLPWVSWELNAAPDGIKGRSLSFEVMGEHEHLLVN